MVGSALIEISTYFISTHRILHSYFTTYGQGENRDSATPARKIRLVVAGGRLEHSPTAPRAGEHLAFSSLDSGSARSYALCRTDDRRIQHMRFLLGVMLASFALAGVALLWWLRLPGRRGADLAGLWLQNAWALRPAAQLRKGSNDATDHRDGVSRRDRPWRAGVRDRICRPADHFGAGRVYAAGRRMPAFRPIATISATISATNSMAGVTVSWSSTADAPSVRNG
jgi:hypothetical protein